MLFFCRSFLGWVGRIRSRKLGTIGRAQRFQKENTQTHTTTITTATKSPLQHGLGLAGLCFSLLSISLFPPLSRRAGLWPLGPRNSAPASPLPWGVTAPPSPPQETGPQGQAAPAARPGPAVLQGNLARGTELEGNFGISQETIVGEEGVGYVRFLYFPDTAPKRERRARKANAFLVDFYRPLPTPRLR